MSTEQTQKYCKKCQGMQLQARPGTNHILHLLITIFLCGAWIPIWILSSMKIGGWRCQKCGSTNGNFPMFLLAFLLIPLGLFFGLRRLSGFQKANSGSISPAQQTPPPQQTLPTQQMRPSHQTPHPQQTPPPKQEPVQPKTPTIHEVLEIETLEGVALPVTLNVTFPFNLLDSKGKESLIPIDASVLVVKRSPSGTLTMKIGGEIYVGNEMRLAKKVRIAPK